MDPRQLRTLGLLGGALAALGALYLAGPAEEEQGSRVHAGVPLDQAISIHLERHVDDREEEIDLEKRDGIWWVVRPFEAEADPDVVFGVLNAVARAEHGRPVDGPLADFGLEPPAAVAEIGLLSGAPVRLEVGAPAPVGLATYVRGDGGPAVVEGRPVDELTKRVQEYRDHKIFRFDPGQVEVVKKGRPRASKRKNEAVNNNVICTSHIT